MIGYIHFALFEHLVSTVRQVLYLTHTQSDRKRFVVSNNFSLEKNSLQQGLSGNSYRSLLICLKLYPWGGGGF